MESAVVDDWSGNHHMERARMITAWSKNREFMME
jgi:hypothetical protein